MCMFTGGDVQVLLLMICRLRDGVLSAFCLGVSCRSKSYGFVDSTGYSYIFVSSAD